MANQIVTSGLFPVNIGSGLTFSEDTSTLSSTGGGGGATPSLADVISVSNIVDNETVIISEGSNSSILFGHNALRLTGGTPSQYLSAIIDRRSFAIVNDDTNPFLIFNGVVSIGDAGSFLNGTVLTVDDPNQLVTINSTGSVSIGDTQFSVNRTRLNIDDPNIQVFLGNNGNFLNIDGVTHTILLVADSTTSVEINPNIVTISSPITNIGDNDSNNWLSVDPQGSVVSMGNLSSPSGTYVMVDDSAGSFEVFAGTFSMNSHVGVTGTFSVPTSITVVNGIITAIS